MRRLVFSLNANLRIALEIASALDDLCYLMMKNERVLSVMPYRNEK